MGIIELSLVGKYQEKQDRCINGVIDNKEGCMDAIIKFGSVPGLFLRHGCFL
jgi:hypothetical protein